MNEHKLFFGFLAILAFNIYYFPFVSADEAYENQESKLYLGKSSSVSALHKVLNDWDDLKKAIMDYAINLDSKHYNKSCRFQDLTIDNILSVDSYSHEEIKKYHKNIYSKLKNKTSLVQVVETRDPCSLDKNSPTIFWFFTVTNDTYQVLDELSIIGEFADKWAGCKD